ncbi:peptidoglycan-binding protein [Rhodobacteraceae bacterium CCMM004]|nr:peptidoglycan-binding protein [Rhodobacteraceae bacterium CCMM004]
MRLRAAGWLVSVAIALTWAGGAAMAQQQVWLQIEAQPGLTRAQQAASRYAQRLPDVSGFRLGSTNWYAIALGPYGEDEAAGVRQQLRAQRLIPADSFTTDGASFRQRFWPLGSDTAAVETPPATAAPLDETPTPDAAEPADTAAEPADTAAAPAPPPPDETPAEARRSERTLTAEERRALQIALQWEGYYTAAIDGAFGRGTRAAMAAWQEAQGYDATGVLTTGQRRELLAAYNAVLDGIGMRVVRDDTAGIEVQMPTELVRFDRYEPPFAHYEGVDPNAPYRVLLISQEGDRATLHGLYDIMQTLAIVPETGAREKRDRNFTLVGEGRDFVSQTEAMVRDGTVKGFTLIWPRDDERRRTRVINAMMDSFVALPGQVLDDVAPGEEQSIDLLAGLEIRRPEVSRSGFYVSPRGEVLTTADAVAACGRITLNEEIEATVAARDAASGLALLRPSQALAPRSYARFLVEVPRLQSKVVLAGYSYEGILGAPSLTYGALADLRGLDGDERIKRFDLEARDGDAGGPILDESGAVMGMMLPRTGDGARDLPATVSFAADVETISTFLGGAGVTPAAADRGPRLAQADLNRLAGEMTVLVGCWE